MLVPTRQPTTDYQSSGFWVDRTLPSYLEEAATTQPDVTAICDAESPMTYLELRDSAARVASALRHHGVHRGDVVSVFLPNWPEAVVVVHGVTWAGCVTNPIVTTYRRAELTYILGASNARVIFTPHVFRGFDYVALMDEVLATVQDPPLVVVVRPQGTLPPGFVSFGELLGHDQVAEPVGDPADICLMLFTSGTTSQPKGVLHSHQTVICDMRSIIDQFGLDSDDRVFMPSPVGHLTGIVYGIYLPTLLPQSTSLLDIWDAEAALAIIERDGCTASLGATPFLSGLTAAYERRGSCSSLRLFICGGADVPPDAVIRGARSFDAVVTRTYGSSEMPTFSISGPSTSERVRSQTDGLPIGPNRGYLINARDGVGELVVRGPEMFLGYLDAALNEGAFTPDGYFRTGDLVCIDDAGAISVRGRVKDIIIRGGENISAREVELKLADHPAIEEAAVVGYPDTRMGERVGAFLVLRADTATTFTLADAGAYLDAQGLAAHKRPERIEIVAELPRTASGKVHKHELRQRISVQTEVD